MQRVSYIKQIEAKIDSISMGRKLTVGFALVTILTFGIALYSLLELKKELSLIEQMYSHPYLVSNAVKRIHEDAQSIDVLALSMIIYKQMIDKEKVIKEIKKYDSRINESFKIIFNQYLGPKENVEQLFQSYSYLFSKRVELITMIQEDRYENAQELMKELMSIHTDDLDKKLQVIGVFADNKADKFFKTAQISEERTIFYIVLAILISIGFSLIITVTTIRGIMVPIRQLIGLTQEINDGNVILSNNIIMQKIARREDEIGLLFNSFTRLMEHLLLPYENIAQNNQPLVDKTDEVKRLLDSFDKYIIASKTDVNGIITYVSQAFQDASGYTREELIGKSQNIVRYQDMPEEIFNDMWTTIKSGNTWTGEIKNRTKGGDFYWIKTTVSSDIDSEGNIVGYKAISENITSAKAYENLSKTLEDRVLQEITKNNEKTVCMLQQSRFAQMGEMISMIAHQWRQPLASISAVSGTLFLDVVTDNYNKDFFEERLNAISELSQHLSQTIDDFRDFFKKDKIIEKANLSDIVNSCLQIIDSSLKNKNINVAININENFFIESYLNELKQVILNIFKNAEDALMEKRNEEACIWLSGYQKESNAYIVIEDNAGGVPENIISKVFDPYFTSKTKKDGTGLGLYMSKIIIEEHCGGILTLNNTKEGACFTIILPIKHEEIL
ncbi:MAG: ATP-binding protein [Sulfurimonas sp.]